MIVAIIPVMDTLRLIARKNPMLGLIIEARIAIRKACPRLFANKRAIAAGPMKNEITIIAPTLLKDVTATKDVIVIRL